MNLLQLIRNSKESDTFSVINLHVQCQVVDWIFRDSFFLLSVLDFNKLCGFHNHELYASIFIGVKLHAIKRCSAASRKCAYHSCEQRDNLMRPSRKMRCTILKKERTYIPKHSKVCSNHNELGSWGDVETPIYDYSEDQVEDLIDLLLNPNESTQLPDSEMRTATGLTQEQFDELLSSLPTLIARYG